MDIESGTLTAHDENAILCDDQKTNALHKRSKSYGSQAPVFKLRNETKRGIGNKPTQRHVYNTCRMNKVKILAILEPKVAFDENFFTRRLGFHKAVSNCSNFIWLFADFDLDLEVVWDHEQFIHVVIRSNLFHKPIWCTFVYASCSRSERNLWDCIFQITSVNAQEPWLIGGDFNIILSAQEKRGGAQPKFRAMEDFANMVLECGLIDAGFEGTAHTWSNRITWERLDRFLYSEAWLDTFTTTRVIHLSRTWSDHAPLLINLESNLVKPPSSFRFMRMWIKHHDFLNTVEQSWKHPTGVYGLINLQQKLYRLKQHLKWWNKNVFGDLFDNIKKAQEQVLISESLYDAAPSDANLTDLNRANANLTKLLAMEEDFWRQKATCKWIDEGERNTKFFHSLVKKKRSSSKIHSICHQGQHISDPNEIKESAAFFFEELLTNDLVLETDSLSFLNHSVSQQDNDMLCCLPTIEEVKSVVFDMCPDSAAGPDGFSALFYQVCWDIIAQDVLIAVQDFFCCTPMPKNFKATSIALIPKVLNPSVWTDYRSISLCNVSNKICSKIMNDRLSRILPRIVAPSQSGFVGGGSSVIIFF
ncbi:hypothetical protein Sango_3039400 [Sesamum angolense]|uniref:Endonuclease/exonuclease/phosphatase domain-containing protein n=1 Tax=Sesamum angolense TaxID=2727404 RepID=A0AAE1T9E1_9LAMI|nr:hypothetical protein Sango_3039400 [Sesamum angolense]